MSYALIQQHRVMRHAGMHVEEASCLSNNKSLPT